MRPPCESCNNIVDNVIPDCFGCDDLKHFYNEELREIEIMDLSDDKALLNPKLRVSKLLNLIPGKAFV